MRWRGGFLAFAMPASSSCIGVAMDISQGTLECVPHCSHRQSTESTRFIPGKRGVSPHRPAPSDVGLRPRRRPVLCSLSLPRPPDLRPSDDLARVAQCFVPRAVGCVIRIASRGEPDQVKRNHESLGLHEARDPARRLFRASSAAERVYRSGS